MELKLQVGSGDFRNFVLTSGQIVVSRLYLEARRPSYAERATAKNRAVCLQFELPKGAASARCMLGVGEASDYLAGLGVPTGAFWQAAHELGWPEAAAHLGESAAQPVATTIRALVSQAADLIARLDEIDPEDEYDLVELLQTTNDLTLVLAEIANALRAATRAGQPVAAGIIAELVTCVSAGLVGTGIHPENVLAVQAAEAFLQGVSAPDDRMRQALEHLQRSRELHQQPTPPTPPEPDPAAQHIAALLAEFQRLAGQLYASQYARHEWVLGRASVQAAAEFLAGQEAGQPPEITMIATFRAWRASESETDCAHFWDAYDAFTAGGLAAVTPAGQALAAYARCEYATDFGDACGDEWAQAVAVCEAQS